MKTEFWKGAKVALQLRNIKSVQDYSEIIKLNNRSANAWIAGNNSGDSKYMEKKNKVSDRCFEKAKEIAKKNKWKISAPGLYWEIFDKKGMRI